MSVSRRRERRANGFTVKTQGPGSVRIPVSNQFGESGCFLLSSIRTLSDESLLGNYRNERGVGVYIQLDGAEIARQLSQRGFDVPGILSMYLFVSIYACMYV